MAVHIPLSSILTFQCNLRSCKLFYCQPSPDPAVLMPNIHLCSAAAPVTLHVQNFVHTASSSRVQIPGDFPVNKVKFLFSLMPLYTTLTRHISVSQVIRGVQCHTVIKEEIPTASNSSAFRDFLLSCHNSAHSRSHHCLTFSANSSRILLACKRNLKSWDSKARHRFCQSIQLPFSTVSSAIVKLIIHLRSRLRCSKNPTEKKVKKKERILERQTFHPLCLVFLGPSYRTATGHFLNR